MNYFIEISETAEKQLSKIKDRRLKSNILNKIKSLESNATKGKYLFKNYYELKSMNYRIYYSVYKGIVIIKNITYIGKIKVNKIGTKNSQERDLQSLR